jgi:raffinose/stachyose/melibiose transport system permease protein
MSIQSVQRQSGIVSHTTIALFAWLQKALAALFILFWCLVVLVPLVVLISVAVKSAPELLANPFGWPRQFLWSNFLDAWNNAALGQALGNSILITTFSIIILILCGAPAAYPLARNTGTWSNRLYIYFVAGLIVPLQLFMIPLYREMHDLQLINTYYGAILLYVASQLPFVIFLYTGFIKTVPRELEEAALIDGASTWRTFWTIIFPLLTPVTATVAITASLSIWNDFFVPLLFLQKDEMHTLTLAIYSFVGQYNNNWTLIFASVIVSSLPLIMLFLFLQKYFIKGITGGALKG